MPNNQSSQRQGDKKHVYLDGPAEVQLCNGDSSTEILMSADQIITLEKMFGPLIFTDIRCRADYARGDWVIERLCGQEWKEWATIPGQLDTDFPPES